MRAGRNEARGALPPPCGEGEPAAGGLGEGFGAKRANVSLLSGLGRRFDPPPPATRSPSPLAGEGWREGKEGVRGGVLPL